MQLFTAVHSSTGTFRIFSDRLLILVIKFYRIHIYTIPMIMMHAVLLHWLVYWLVTYSSSFSDNSKFTYDNVSDLIVHFALLYFFLRYLLFIFQCTFVLMVRFFHNKYTRWWDRCASKMHKCVQQESLDISDYTTAQFSLYFRHHVVMRCPSVRLSVIETNEHIFKKVSPSGSHTVLVSPHHTLWQYSDGDP